VYLSGWIYEARHGYELSLILSCLVGLVAAAVVFGVREPDRQGGERQQAQRRPVEVGSLAAERQPA
jgi:hypothetical protein